MRFVLAALVALAPLGAAAQAFPSKAIRMIVPFTPGSATDTMAHISAEKFRMAAGIDAVHVPFKGSPESITETMGGRTQYTWTPLSSAVGQIRSGQLLALAVSTAQRSAALPDVPTIAEAGFPRGVFNFWVGMLAPANTPREILARLNAEVQRALHSAEMKERLATLGSEPMAMTPEQFDAFIKEEFTVLGEVMRASGVKAQ